MGLFSGLFSFSFKRRRRPRLLKSFFKEAFAPQLNELKGEIGEAKVDKKLNPLLFGRVEHRQINNLTLIDDRGKSHQIDHVEIRSNGIFCIETKSYIGWIFGDENQDFWTQSLYNGETNKLRNPLKQNSSHVYHIKKALGNKYRVNSVVVMVNNNADRIDCSNVVNLNDLKSYLSNFDNGVFLSTEEMDHIYKKLLLANANLSKKEHLENINKTQEELRSGICPRCGGKLVKKSGKYGEFYGCSNYPKCKFTLNIQ